MFLKAQSRINLFFAKPSKGASDVAQVHEQVDRPAPEHAHQSGPETSYASPSKHFWSSSDYNKAFLPFAAPSNATVAPINHFQWDNESTRLATRHADEWLSTQSDHKAPPRSLRECLDLGPHEALSRGYHPMPVPEIIKQMEDAEPQHANAGMELKGSKRIRPQTLLQDIPMKYISFHEDVRPPYIGTLSSSRTRHSTRHIIYHPTAKVDQHIDYDYDSEAEWEEPEEGEDLGSDLGDDEESVDEAEDFEEFLDDDDEAVPRTKRKLLSGDMQPISSGMCWEGESGEVPANHAGYITSDQRLEVLIGKVISTRVLDIPLT